MALLDFYKAMTSLGTPILERMLRKRLAQGKEQAARLCERRGIATVDRPAGKLVWIHAASVGESLSVLPIIKKLSEDFPSAGVLVTSGTLTSARLLEDLLPPKVIHQFVPLDQPRWVKAFLDHWQPNAAFWVESELWPNLLLQTSARKVPMALINARMSERSFQRWSKAISITRSLLGTFDVCLAQDELQAQRLRSLGAKTVMSVGNLKFAGQHLDVDSLQLTTLQKKTGSRPLWMAASTHEGEEVAAMDVHRQLQQVHPDLLTVIVPRHPERCDGIKKELRSRRLRFSSWSKTKAPGVNDQVFLVDTLGDLPRFCALSPICFMGGSMNVGAGGHNIIEPARLGSAIVFGPDMGNFLTLAAEFLGKAAALQVREESELAGAIDSLLVDEAARERQIAMASAIAERENRVVEAVYSELQPVLGMAEISSMAGNEQALL